MKFNSSLLVAAISFGSSLVQASPMAVAEAIATQKMTYMGPITPGGENVTLLGDAREIHAQIMKLNPKFNPMDFPDESTKLHKRSKRSITCKPQGFLAWPAIIDEGIAYLKGLPGNCGVEKGPAKCARISCSYSSGIYLCNDNTHRIAPSCKYLATYAEDIRHRCTTPEGVIGQEFDTDRYNVIVKGDAC